MRDVLQNGHFHHSREMFDFLLELLGDGVFDKTNDLHWHLLTEMAEQQPQYGVEFLTQSLGRIIAQASIRGQTNPFAEEGKKRSIDPHFIRVIAQNAPAEFSEYIIPIIKALVLANAHPEQCGGHFDEIWQYHSFGADYDTHEALFSASKEALQALAKANPAKCVMILSGWQELEHKTLRFLLLSAWLGNPPYFAETAASYFADHPLSFEVRYNFIIGDGGANDGITLPLLRAISPLLTEATHLRLESAIRGYVSPYERKNPNLRGSQTLVLLGALQPDRLTQESRLRIEELHRKFPEKRLSLDKKRVWDQARHSSRVQSPIPFSAVSKMTDDHWIRAFRKYGSTQHGELRGSASELRKMLQEAVKVDRKRFAELALHLPDDILPDYFDAILWALVEGIGSPNQCGKDGQKDTASPNNTPLDCVILKEVIKRVHRLPLKPCGRAICRVAETLAYHPIPMELLEIVVDYAVNDPDPETEIWNVEAGSGIKYYGGNPLLAGINSGRGGAADCLSHFLFAHPELADRVYPQIATLAHDRSTSVRAVNIQCLLALMNTHRDKAIELFLRTCEEREDLWALQTLENFLYHATITHYVIIQPLLQKMLKAPSANARHAAARQVTLAEFRHPEAKAELELVMKGDEECRRAAAEIYALNVHHESVRECCITRLKSLFNDPSKAVRDAAEDWLRDCRGEWRQWQRDLLSAFAESHAFLDGGREWMMTIEKAVGPLPSEFLNLAQKAVDLYAEKILTDPSHALGFSYNLPALVIRFYEQSKDSGIRRNCLNLLDRMLAFGWGDVASELKKFDR